MIAKRAETNPDFPAMVDAAVAARAERWAKLEAANEGAPDITEEELVDAVLARRERESDGGSPS
jgi:hypothetical protein